MIVEALASVHQLNSTWTMMIVGESMVGIIDYSLCTALALIVSVFLEDASKPATNHGPRVIKGAPLPGQVLAPKSTAQPVDEIEAGDKENKQNLLNSRVRNTNVKTKKVTAGFIGSIPVVCDIQDSPSDNEDHVAEEEEDEEVEEPPCNEQDGNDEGNVSMVKRGSQFISNDPCDLPIEAFQIDVKIKHRILNAPRYNRVQSKSVKTSYHVYLTEADRILPLKEHLDILVKLLYSLQAKKLRVLNIKSEVIPAISYK